MILNFLHFIWNRRHRIILSVTFLQKLQKYFIIIKVRYDKTIFGISYFVTLQQCFYASDACLTNNIRGKEILSYSMTNTLRRNHIYNLKFITRYLYENRHPYLWLRHFLGGKRHAQPQLKLRCGLTC